MLHTQSLTWHKQTKQKNTTVCISGTYLAYIVEKNMLFIWYILGNTLLKNHIVCLSGALMCYWVFFVHTEHALMKKHTVSGSVYLVHTGKHTAENPHCLCIRGFDLSCYFLVHTEHTLMKNHTVCWSKGSIWSVALFVVHTEQVITHVSLLEKKTNTVYLTVSEGSICYCLFHMYLTHFYSHVIAEKPFSYMYLTHFYLHVIAEKNIFICTWHTFTHMSLPKPNRLCIWRFSLLLSFL